MAEAPPTLGAGETPAWLTSAIPARLGLFLRDDGIRGRLARGSLAVFLVNVLGTLLAFAVQILLARMLGATHYGVYAYVLGWLNIVLLLAKLDFDSAATRFLGAYRGRAEWGLLRGYLRRSHEIVTVASLVVALVASAAVWANRERLGPAVETSAFIACALLPITALLQLKSASLQGLQHVVEAQAPGMVLRPLLFGAGILLAAYVWQIDVQAPQAVAINLVTTGVALLFSVALLRRVTPQEARHVKPSYASREWNRVAFGLLIISASQVVLSQQADVVVVGTIVGTTAAGHYGAASQLSTLVQFGVAAVLFVATPLIAELYAQESRGALQRLVMLVGRINLAISLPIVAALALAGEFVLGWYGPTFDEAYPVLLVLSASQFVAAALGSLAGFLLTMTGHHYEAARIIGLSAVVNLALTFLLTPAFGILGAAAATLTGIVLRSVLLYFAIRKHLQLDPLPFLVRRRDAAA